MTRFYFDLFNDEKTVDEEGVEFPDLEAARRWAVGEVRSLAAHSVREYAHFVRSHHIVIRDGASEVARVRFDDVIEVKD